MTEEVTLQQVGNAEFSYPSSVDEALAALPPGNGKLDVVILPVGGSTFPHLA